MREPICTVPLLRRLVLSVLCVVSTAAVVSWALARTAKPAAARVVAESNEAQATTFVVDAATGSDRRGPPPRGCPRWLDEPADCDPVLDFDCTATAAGKTGEPLTRTDVLRVIKGAVGPAEACLRAHEEAATVRVRWRIPAEGKPREVEVIDDVSPALRRCLTDVVSLLRFPAKDRDLASPVTFPFRLLTSR